MPSRLGLYCAENIGRAAALVLVIASRFPPRSGRRSGTDIRMQCHRFLVQADYRLLGIVGLLIHLQHVLHLGDVVFIEVGHAPHFFPATA